MNETMKNLEQEELDGQMYLFKDEATVEESVEKQTNVPSSDDTLKEAIQEQLKKIQRQNLLIGAQTVAHVILEKISKAESQPGKRTMNDYRRLIKEIRNFCEVGVSRKVNADGETESINDSSNADENSTKLMEEAEWK